MGDEAASSLGERLVRGVDALWQEVRGQRIVVDHHGQEIEALKKRMADLERQVHGLRVSRGRARSQNEKLTTLLQEADRKLGDIRSSLS